MKSATQLIQEHLESALFIAANMPVSQFQLCLERQLEDAREKWVDMYLAGLQRHERGQVRP